MKFLIATLALLGFCLMISAVSALIDYFIYKHERRELIRRRSCSVCSRRGTYECPDASLCYETKNRPCFRPEERNK